jgi:hypothetical protein
MSSDRVSSPEPREVPILRAPNLAAAAILATALALPAAFAQPAAPSPAPAPTPPNAGSAAAPPVETGRLQRVHGGWRSSQIVGATVYNDRDERIGAVDDLIVGQDGTIAEAVLSVGGVLGLGAKLVAVPYDQLRFEERTDTRTTAGAPVPDGGAAPGAPIGTPPAPAGPGVPAATPPARPVASVRLVLPGATRDSLNALPEFRYRD